MTDEQKKMIEKLNEDNRKLNDVNKGMKDYAKYKLGVGILVVTIIIVLFFFSVIPDLMMGKTVETGGEANNLEVVVWQCNHSSEIILFKIRKRV